MAQCYTCVISGRWGPTVSAEPGGHTPCFDLRRMTSVRCIRCVAYGSLEPTLKSRFHGPTCGFQVVLRNTRNATDARLATQSKTEIHNACTQKTQHTQSILFFVLRFSSAYIVCIGSAALRTTAWKPTFKSVFCILMAAALFGRSARVRQPAIAKFLFMMDEQFVKFDDRRCSGI